MYAVEVRGFPPYRSLGAPTERELKYHFQNLFGPVYECSFVRNFGSFLETYMDVEEKLAEVELLEEKAFLKAQEMRADPESSHLVKKAREEYELLRKEAEQ